MAGIDSTNVAGFLREQREDYLAAGPKIFVKALREVWRNPASYGLILERNFIGPRNDRTLVFKVG